MTHYINSVFSSQHNLFYRSLLIQSNWQSRLSNIFPLGSIQKVVIKLNKNNSFPCFSCSRICYNNQEAIFGGKSFITVHHSSGLPLIPALSALQELSVIPTLKLSRSMPFSLHHCLYVTSWNSNSLPFFILYLLFSICFYRFSFQIYFPSFNNYFLLYPQELVPHH